MDDTEDGDFDFDKSWTVTTTFDPATVASTITFPSTSFKFSSFASAFGVGATTLAAAFSVLAF